MSGVVLQGTKKEKTELKNPFCWRRLCSSARGVGGRSWPRLLAGQNSVGLLKDQSRRRDSESAVTSCLR